MNVIARILAFSLLLVMVLSVAGAGLLYYLNLPGERLGSEGVEFTIHPGESQSSVERRLVSEHIIRHEVIFRIFSVFEKNSTIKSGTYRIETGYSAREVYELFVSGRQVLTKITIPEGWTVSKIAQHLEEKGICTASSFRAAASDAGLLRKYGIPGQTVEGYLFPDTYLFPADYPPEKAVDFMLATFFRKLETVYPDYRKQNSAQLNEKIIVASIIEREYRLPSDAPIMASVFYNRLKIRMHLGSCATVEYVLSELQNREHPEYLTYRDLETESDYNTYIHIGLPPGPISNPGETALKAAFSPAKTDYLYFVLQNPETGKHFFSRNLDEHNLARKFYLKKY